MGSIAFDDIDRALAESTSSPDMNDARGSNGCAMESDRI
jgi:hypothetical protein